MSNSGANFEGLIPSNVETSKHLVTEPTVYVTQEGSDTERSGLGWGQAFRTGKKAVEFLETLPGATGTIRFGYGKWIEAVKRLPGGYAYGQGGRGEETIIEFPASTEIGGALYDKYWGSPTTVGIGGEIDHLCIYGNYANQTYSAPSTIVTESISVTSAGVTLKVLSVSSSFPTASGSTLWIGEKFCTYTGVSGSTFTGVRPANGTTFTATVEMLVQPGAGIGNGIAIQSAYTIIGSDIYVNHCAGHGIVAQGAGETGNNSLEIRIEAKRVETNKGYGIALLPFAPDGHMGKVDGGGNVLGGLLNMNGEWKYYNYHPVGGNAGIATLNRSLIRLTKRQHQFVNLDLDSFAYDGILLDDLAANQSVSDIQIQGMCQHACFAASNAGSIVACYGNGSTSSAERIRLVGTFPGRIDYPISPMPHGYLVGEQNLKTISEANGKVQILNALQISPNSTLGGKLKFSTGDELSYGKSSSFGTSVKSAATSGATTLELNVAPPSASGIVTVSTASTSASPVEALRVKYGKFTGTKLEECTGITENIASGTGVAQHYIEEVGNGTTVAAANGTSYTQPGRAIVTVNGEDSSLLGAATSAGEGGPFNSIYPSGLGVRRVSEYNYRIIFQGVAILNAQTATTTGINESGLASPAGGSGGKDMFYINPADYPAGSTLRTVITAATNATAPESNFTIALYPVSAPSGITNEVKLTVGSQVAKSAAVVTAPAKESLLESVSEAITLPTAAGFYILQLIVSANNAVASAVAIRARLEAKV